MSVVSLGIGTASLAVPIPGIPARPLVKKLSATKLFGVRKFP